MTFTQTFGGTTIYPAGVSYRAIALSANQILTWPTEVATSTNVVAQIMDVTPSAASLSIFMPPATEVSVGETALFFNAGSFAFIVKDTSGNTIVSIAPGLSYQVYLIGNTTANGTWRSTQYAAGTSSATAGSLVGAGIKAIGTTLNQSMSVTSLNTNYTIGDPDRSGAFLWTGGAGTLTLPSASVVGSDWFCQVRNSGTGAININPVGGELINGAATLAFNPGDSSIISCDGTGFFTIGFGQAPEFLFDYVTVNLTGSGSVYTLSGANLNRIAYSFYGALANNVSIEVPATFQQYWISNDTTGGYTLTVKVSGQPGVAIAQGARAIFYCNGTDVVLADTASFSFPVLVSQGGTGATTESGARVNLGGTSVGINVFTAVTAADARTAMSAAQSGANTDITSLSGLTTPLSVPQGGTGVATLAANGVMYGSGVSAVAVTPAGTTGQVLIGNTGSAPSWSALSGIGVTSFNAGTTGFTPSTATSGPITLSGTLVAANGGTGFSSYAVGDILYASTTTSFSKLSDVATGNALISGGVGAAPSYGKIGLTTHISGTLGVGNGGTGATTLTSGYLVKGNGGSAVSASVVYDDGTNVGIGVTPSAWSGQTALQIASGGAIAFNNQYGEVVSNVYYNAGYKYIGTGLATKYSQEDGVHVWYNAVSGTAGNAVTFVERFRIGPVGQFGLAGANYGTAGQVLTSQGSSTAPIWSSASAGSVVSVSGTGTVSGISLSGTVTVSGSLTLGGTLDLSSPPAIGGTTPSTGTFTTLLSTAMRETKTTTVTSNLNLANGNYFSHTVSGSTTFTVSNVPTAGTAVSLIFDITNGGSAAITWWANVKWPGGSAPTLTASGRDVLGFYTYDNGTTWSGFVLGRDVK